MNEITCELILTPGAIERVTDAFVELHREIRNGLHEGPPTKNEKEEQPA